ncbi:hypothetical protein DPEC_G00155400 [Dallia pectoralis]|uniref:Uncharacterized protein n=1 Tax=Dallia pectoralis TaxID=75939 RepID=A0ACC2GKG7_DALPE|nr:hypothetical protein DPEC_G00155400 [Dallia pectoralis]
MVDFNFRVPLLCCVVRRGPEPPCRRIRAASRHGLDSAHTQLRRTRSSGRSGTSLDPPPEERRELGKMVELQNPGGALAGCLGSVESGVGRANRHGDMREVRWEVWWECWMLYTVQRSHDSVELRHGNRSIRAAMAFG